MTHTTYGSSGVSSAISSVNCTSKLEVNWFSGMSGSSVGINGGVTLFSASLKVHKFAYKKPIEWHRPTKLKWPLILGIFVDFDFVSGWRIWGYRLIDILSGNMSISYQIPVDSLEKWMAGDVWKRWILVAAQTVSRILVQEALQHLASFYTQWTRYTNGSLQNHLE